jgi:hypothetical protein
MKRCLLMLVLLTSSSVVLAQTEDGNGVKPPGSKSQVMPERHVDGVVERGTQASLDRRGGKVQDAQPERAACERSLRNWFKRRCRSDSQ